MWWTLPGVCQAWWRWQRTHMIKIGSLCHTEKQPCSKIDLRSHVSPTVYNVGRARLSGPHCLCLCNGNSKAYLKCRERPEGRCKKSNGHQNCNQTEAGRRRGLCFFPLGLGKLRVQSPTTVHMFYILSHSWLCKERYYNYFTVLPMGIRFIYYKIPGPSAAWHKQVKMSNTRTPVSNWNKRMSHALNILDSLGPAQGFSPDLRTDTNGSIGSPCIHATQDKDYAVPHRNTSRQ